jgi:colanic acid biosynthesis protein WcaH
MTTRVGDDEFAQVVRLAPLVSIDLIIRDSNRKVLVALRTNEPAKGLYFIPGGRIRKDETIEAAFVRILKAETGCRVPFQDAQYRGVYQHFYSTNRYGLDGFGTHYVALAYELQLGYRSAVTLDDQHSEHRWMSEEELKAAPDVHNNTKAFFR